jgi:hypothetical protein
VGTVLVAGCLLFVGVVSGALLWEGLALGLAHGPAIGPHARARARARIAFGAIGLALVVWIATGLLTHAR